MHAHYLTSVFLGLMLLIMIFSLTFSYLVLGFVGIGYLGIGFANCFCYSFFVMFMENTLSNSLLLIN